jgi:hypothetical protein
VSLPGHRGELPRPSPSSDKEPAGAAGCPCRRRGPGHSRGRMGRRSVEEEMGEREVPLGSATPAPWPPRPEVEDEGKEVISSSFFTPIRLQVGPIRRHAYIMASFKQVVNCNGTDIVSRIVMTIFKIVIIIMAQI